MMRRRVCPLRLNQLSTPETFSVRLPKQIGEPETKLPLPKVRVTLKRSDAATDAMSGSLTKSLLDVGRGLQRVCAWKADIKWYGERDAG